MSQAKPKNDSDELTFKVENKPALRSEYDDGVDDKKRAEEHKAFLNAVTIDDDEPDYEKEDEYGRDRVHAWILMNKGSREIQYPFFIEPTTGRRYEIDSSPYHSIQAIFNHQNFWVNLDPAREIDEVNLDFKEDTNGEWEYVMIQPGSKKDEDEDIEGNDDLSSQGS
mmetsp:Transcript_35902/g.26171  ORF Transcript_35902/g.26171 Transcript_35902/m.26171 type:complete len:167 (+) Transcript_35902:612-1112(+)